MLERCHVHCEQLQRHHVHERTHERGAFRTPEHDVRHIRHILIAFFGDGDGERAARLHFLDGAHDLGMQDVAPTRRRHDDHDGFTFIHERDRTVLELACRESFGERVGDFLELQRAFERNRIADMTAKEQEGVGIDHATRRVFDDVRLRVDDTLNLRRHSSKRLKGV